MIFSDDTIGVKGDVFVAADADLAVVYAESEEARRRRGFLPFPVMHDDGDTCLQVELRKLVAETKLDVHQACLTAF